MNTLYRLLRLSLKVFHLRGVSLYLHWSLLAFMGLLWYLTGDWMVPTLMCSVYAFVAMHEYGHVIAAQRLGVPVGHIVLTPIGGIANIGIPNGEIRKELLVTLAGPAVNVVLCLVFLLLLCVFEDSGLLALFGFGLKVNALLFGFNMLPAFPMDGGRLFRATLANFVSYYRATHIAVRLGQVAGVLMWVGGIYFGYFGLVALGPFMVLAGFYEWQHAKVSENLKKFRTAIALNEQGRHDEAMAVAQGVECGRLALERCLTVLREMPQPEMAVKLLAHLDDNCLADVQQTMLDIELNYVRKQNADLDRLMSAVSRGASREEIAQIVEGMEEGDFKEHCRKLLENWRPN